MIKKPTLDNALSANAEGIDVIYLSRSASDGFLKTTTDDTISYPLLNPI